MTHSAKIKIFGIGKPGIRVIDMMAESKSEEIELIAIDNDAAPSGLSKSGNKTFLKHNHLSEEEITEDVFKSFNTRYGNLGHFVFVISVVETASDVSLLTKLTSLCRKMDTQLTTAVVLTPFPVVDKKTSGFTNAQLMEIQQSSDGVVVMPPPDPMVGKNFSGEKLLKKKVSAYVDPNQGEGVYSAAVYLIKGIINLFTRTTGLISPEFEDIRFLLTSGVTMGLTMEVDIETSIVDALEEMMTVFTWNGKPVKEAKAIFVTALLKHSRVKAIIEDLEKLDHYLKMKTSDTTETFYCTTDDASFINKMRVVVYISF